MIFHTSLKPDMRLLPNLSRHFYCIIHYGKHIFHAENHFLTVYVSRSSHFSNIFIFSSKCVNFISASIIWKRQVTFFWPSTHWSPWLQKTLCILLKGSNLVLLLCQWRLRLTAGFTIVTCCLSFSSTLQTSVLVSSPVKRKTQKIIMSPFIEFHPNLEKNLSSVTSELWLSLLGPPLSKFHWWIFNLWPLVTFWVHSLAISSHICGFNLWHLGKFWVHSLSISCLICGFNL